MLDLGLRGSRLLVFAVVYRYSGEGKGEYYGSLDYIAEWCGISRAQASLILRDLTAEGILEKLAAPDRPHYRIKADVWKTKRLENQTGSLEIQTPRLENQTTSDNRVDNKADNRYTHSSPRAREDKVLYGDCVLLTASEHDKLVAEFGTDDTARLISILDLYLANKTKDPYKSHYAAIKKWCVRDLAEQKTAEQRLKNAQEAGQRVNAQHAPATGFGAGLADANRRFKEITDKYKN